MRFFSKSLSIRAAVVSFAVLVAATVVLPATAADAAVFQKFDKVYSVNANGSIVFAANSVMTCSTASGATGATGCAAARSASAGSAYNNNFTGQYIDVDGVAGTFNSSSANLTVPSGGGVMFAALVWGGRTPQSTGTTNADPALRKNVKFTVPAGSGKKTFDLVGSVASEKASSGNIGYQGYIDVTDLVAAAGTGTYTVANVQSVAGITNAYGGWSLVVAMADPSAPMRNLTVFKGFASISTSSTADSSATFEVSGFLTPPIGPVKTTMGAVTYEGDRGLGGDSLSLNNVPLSDALNQPTDVFNSTISNQGTMVMDRNPAYSNQLGFDADLINADGVLKNGASSATLTVTTNSEQYFPGIVTFASELYDPKLNGAKTVQLVGDANGNSLADNGDTLRYSVVARNDGLDTATESTKPGTMTIDGAVQTDAMGDDAADFAPTMGDGNGAVVARIGVGANAAKGGNIALYDLSSESHTVAFDVEVRGAVQGQNLVNAASLKYAGATTQARSASVSGTVSVVVPSLPVEESVTPKNYVLSLTPTPSQPSITVSPLADMTGSGLHVVAVTDASGGAVTVNADGTATYTPTASFAGRDVFTYTVEDAAGHRGTGLVQIDVVNAVPTAVDDAITAHVAATTVDVLGNDTDGNGDALSVRSISSTPTGTRVTSGSVTTPAGGTVTLTNGIVSYTPPAGGVPSSGDLFSYVVQDSRGGSDDGVVAITFSNTKPTAVADSANAKYNAPVTIDVLGNDSDVDGDTLTVGAVTKPSHGSAAVVQGKVVYTPANGYSGSDSFSYTVTDGFGGSSTAIVTVEVAKNNAPEATDDTISTPGDTPVMINVLTNDRDVDGDFLILTKVDQVRGGTAYITPTGLITFTPGTGFVGTATVTYTVSDGTDSDTGTLTVAVANIVPTVSPLSASTGSGVAATIDVLKGAVDPNVVAGLQSLMVTGATATDGATAEVNADGTITVTPAAGFKGDVTVLYTVSDGVSTTTGTITVTVEDGVPTAIPDLASTTLDKPVSVDVVKNDTDPNSDELSLVDVTEPLDPNGVVRGAAVITDGQVVYTPPAGWSGSATMSYTVSDGVGTASSSLTVTVANVAPVVPPATASTDTGAAQTVDVLSDVTDPNVAAGYQTLTVTDATADNGATVKVNDDGTLTVTPKAGFKGDVTVSYTVSDGVSSTVGTLTVTVANGLPTTLPDVASTTVDTPVSVDVIANDTDPNSDELTLVEVGLPRDADGAVRGSAAQDKGELVFTPPTGWSGSVTIPYTVSDGEGTAEGSATVTVANAVPVVKPATASTDTNTPVAVDVLKGVTDPNVAAGYQSLKVGNATATQGATVEVNDKGELVVTPVAGFKGDVTVNYVVSDGQASVDGTLTVTVANALPAPVADVSSTTVNTPVSVDVLTNDTDANNDELTVAKVGEPRDANGVVRGSAVVTDGELVYTPPTGWSGSVTVSYTVSDGEGSVDSSATITVANAAPVVLPITASTGSGVAITLDPLAGVADPNVTAGYQTLTLVDATADQGATVKVNDDGTITVTPKPGFKGEVTITYTVSDGETTTVGTITVTVADGVPSAVADAATTPLNKPVTVDVLGNDTDPNGDELTLVSVAEPRDADGVVRGTAAIVNGKVVYTPPTDWSGSVSLSYTVTDGASTSTATVTIVVQPAEPVIPLPAAGPGVAASSPAGGALPNTGFSALAPLGAVALLLLAGLGVLLVSRRARRVR
jgi:hypothetical protein